MRRGHPCSGLSKIATRRRPTRHWFLANTKWCFFPFAHTSYPTSRSLTPPTAHPKATRLEPPTLPTRGVAAPGVVGRAGWAKVRMHSSDVHPTLPRRSRRVQTHCLDRTPFHPSHPSHPSHLHLFAALLPSSPPHSIRRTLLPLPCVSPSPSALVRHLEPPSFSLLPPLRHPLPAKPAARAGSWSPPSTPATRCCDSAGRWCPLF